jgi:hypothetical protein
MLLNVRLGPEEEKVVKGLRRAKVNVSALVRKAIREAAPKKGKSANRVAVLEQIIAANPMPPRTDTLERPRLDDRHAMSRYIREQIRRRSGKK